MRSICMVCHQSNKGDLETQRLLRIRDIVKRYEASGKQTSRKVRFPSCDIFYVNLRCHYGCPCGKLEGKERKIHDLSREITRELPVFLCQCSLSEKREVQELCRGYFPNAYSYIERNYCLLHTED